MPIDHLGPNVPAVEPSPPGAAARVATPPPGPSIRGTPRLDPDAAVHAVLAILEEEEVEYIFGVPGGPLTALFEALADRDRIRFVLAKHEEGAALMATSYARVSGRLAVCCATSGPGATNALTGVASAYTEAAPVLFLSGQVATRSFGRGAIQESTPHGVDLVQLFKPITKLSMMAPSAEVLPPMVREGIRQALAVRRGPVHLSLPADLLSSPIARASEGAVGGFRAEGRPVDRAAADRAARRLSAARRPCILAGNGVAQGRAEGELLALAERLSIPVVTTPKGKGAFPETHPLSLGVFGLGGHPLAEAWLDSGVDVLMVVGSGLGEWASSSWDARLQPREALIQVDHDPCVFGRNYRIDIGVVGDARAALGCMLEAAAPKGGVAGDLLAELRARVPRHEGLEPCDEDGPLKPPHLLRELRAAMPDDALLFVDNGNSIMWAGHYFEARVPGTYFIDLGMASMGSAVAGVIGGYLAAPERKAVALVGDAAFAMQGMEVHTAADLGLPIVWVVLNNRGHGMVAHGERLLRGRHLGFAEFRTRLDVAGMATALGAKGLRVDSMRQLRDALREALAAEGPVVIDAEIDDRVAPPTLSRRAQSLARTFDPGESASSTV